MVKLTEAKKVLLKDLVEQARNKDTIRKIPRSWWKEQHDQGKKLKEVAAELNVSPVYLSQCLTRKGIYWRQL